MLQNSSITEEETLPWQLKGGELRCTVTEKTDVSSFGMVFDKKIFKVDLKR